MGFRREALTAGTRPNTMPMTMEKATTGLYLSGHPMDHYRDAVRKLHAPTIVSIIEDFSRENGPERFADGQRVTIAGVITSSKTKTTKNNSLMAYVMVEDSSASIELLCFSKVLSASGSYLSEGNALLLRGRISLRDEKTPQIMCDEALPLDSTISAAAKPARQGPKVLEGRRLVVKCPSIDDPVMRHIQLVLEMFPGPSQLIMVMADTGKRYGAKCLLHRALVEELEETLGKECVVLQQ